MNPAILLGHLIWSRYPNSPFVPADNWNYSLYTIDCKPLVWFRTRLSVIIGSLFRLSSGIARLRASDWLHINCSHDVCKFAQPNYLFHIQVSIQQAGRWCCEGLHLVGQEFCKPKGLVVCQFIWGAAAAYHVVWFLLENYFIAAVFWRIGLPF